MTRNSRGSLHQCVTVSDNATIQYADHLFTTAKFLLMSNMKHSLKWMFNGSVDCQLIVRWRTNALTQPPTAVLHASVFPQSISKYVHTFSFFRCKNANTISTMSLPSTVWQVRYGRQHKAIYGPSINIVCARPPWILANV